MGNNNQKFQSELKSHDKLGLIKIIDNQTSPEGKTIIQIRKAVLNQNSYNDWVKQCQTIESDHSKQILYLPLHHQYQYSGLCGLSGNAVIRYQYFPYLLKAEIQNRRKLDQYFTDQQIWYLLYNMIQTQNILQKEGMAIGDVHPSNILLNEEGQTRFICKCSFPGNKSSFQKIVQSILSDVYLAPQQMDLDSIQKGRQLHNINKNKAQIFSIGMTILQAASLEDCSYLYTRNPFRINKQKLEKYLNILTINENYSRTVVVLAKSKEEFKIDLHDAGSLLDVDFIAVCFQLFDFFQAFRFFQLNQRQ